MRRGGACGRMELSFQMSQDLYGQTAALARLDLYIFGNIKIDPMAHLQIEFSALNRPAYSLRFAAVPPRPWPRL